MYIYIYIYIWLLILILNKKYDQNYVPPFTLPFFFRFSSGSLVFWELSKSCGVNTITLKGKRGWGKKRKQFTTKHDAFRLQSAPLASKNDLPYGVLPFIFRFSSVYSWPKVWSSQPTENHFGMHPKRCWTVQIEMLPFIGPAIASMFPAVPQ